MSYPININGRQFSLTHDLDASKSNYIIIRTKGEPLTKAQKSELQDLGVSIQEFVGSDIEQIYLCGYKKDSLKDISDLEFVQEVGIYESTFSLPSTLESDIDAEPVSVNVLLQHDIKDPSDELLNKIAEAGDIGLDTIVVEKGSVHVQVRSNKLERIAALDEVRVLHTANEPSLFNNVARQILHSDKAVTKNNTLYSGKGQIVCVADTGLDKGSITDIHDAFLGRVKQLFPWGRPTTRLSDDPDGHGTHCCGSVLGSGQHNTQGLIQGTAPEADLIMQSIFSRFNEMNRPMLGGIPSGNLSPLFLQAYEAGARVHTNSWGSPLPASGIQRPYDGRTESIDLFLFEHQDMTILFAGGNDGQDADTNGRIDGKINSRSLGAEAASKNCITVGASENLRPNHKSGDANRKYTYGGFWLDSFPQNPLRDDPMANNPEGLAAFSSRGPTAEDRIKPDIVAPGTAILSTRSRNKKFLTSVNVGGVSGDDRYMYLSGTSMATPLVAGCCAVIREALFEDGHRDEDDDGVKNPTGSLVKALLINGAIPIKGQYMPDEIVDEPNPHSGFGRVDLGESVPKVNNSEISGYGIGAATDDQSDPFEVQIPVPRPKAGGSKWTFKITMVYADLPGAKLQNDLNLVVTQGSFERHGNQFNQFPTGTRGNFDRTNNVEQIIWPNVSSGSLTIQIKPFRFMSERIPFAYAWRFI